MRKIMEFEEALLMLPQEKFPMHHLIHGGMYARSMTLKKGSVITGAKAKLPSILIVSGDVLVYVGNDAKRLVGYNVLSGSAGRKQAFVALEDTELTAIFRSEAKSVEEAEEEFTDDHERLGSRKNPEDNVVQITEE